MITAEEARKQTIAVVKSTELSEIEEQVKDAIQRGEFAITVIALSKHTIDALKELGYTVECEVANPNDRYNDCNGWTISW